MIIAVASGKGGTGKTTVAVSLARSLAQSEAGNDVWLLDCDVEAPNAALFLAPTIEGRHSVRQWIPEVDESLCTHCGRCASVCRYNAIAVVGERVLVFPQLCHGCGSCATNCPAGAIREVPREMGIIEWGRSGALHFAHGIMHIGEAMAVPVIRDLRDVLPSEDGRRPTAILDAPPGTSCPMVAALRGADVALLVTEPTPFGLHDLRIAVDVARGELGMPVGVVINRDGVGDDGVDAYCEAEGIPILLRIPLDQRIAVAYSDGIPLDEALPEYGPHLRALYEDLTRLATEHAAVQEGGPR
ncbi:MAG: P-loop NTPase [Chloroflexi bacterium]|nr:P-loop NTPase [Chloroflexota bacterium]